MNDNGLLINGLPASIIAVKNASAGHTVILVNPHYHRNWRYGQETIAFPVNILAPATMLATAGYKPVVIDTCVDSDYKETIRKHISNALFAGISAMTPQAPHALEIARFIRQISPNTPIVWGGIHPTLYPDTCLNPFCDAAVMGEADETVVTLADTVRSTGQIELIPGLAVERDGKVVSSPLKQLPDFQSLPWMDYSLVDVEKYIFTWSLQELRKVRVMSVQSARGCPWHCAFCINTTLNNSRRYRCRSADDLLDEIETLVNRYDLEMIIFSDEEFFADRQRVEAILDGIQSRGLNHIRFNATCRVNHFRDGYIDSIFLKRLKQCGFVNLVFGFESGSTQCLEIIRKEITVEQGLHAAKLLSVEGFMAVWGFIMAIPGETPDDLMKTLRVMDKIRKMGNQNYFIGPQIFRPYPGSELYRKALEAGLEEPQSLEAWASENFTGEGWIGSDELLWIQPENRAFIEYVNYIAPIYYNRQFLKSSGFKAVYHAFLRMLFAFRLTTNYRKVAFEHTLKTLPEKLYQRVSKVKQ